MALPIWSTIPSMGKLNLVTLMQVGGITRYRGYTFMGIMPFPIANSLPGQNPLALVQATRSYFRDGSEVDHTKISYVALRADGNSPIILIPEPLVQANSIELGTTTRHTITVEGDVSRDQLAVILSSNGIEKYNITSETI